MASAARGPRVFVGLAILAIGVVFLLENLTDWEIPWGGWWPVILIVMGTWNLVRKDSSRVGAIALIALGVFFLLDTQDVWEYSIGDIWRFWPVVSDPGRGEDALGPQQEALTTGASTTH